MKYVKGGVGRTRFCGTLHNLQLREFVLPALKVLTKTASFCTSVGLTYYSNHYFKFIWIVNLKDILA